MVPYNIEFAESVRKDFRKVPEAEAIRILSKIQDLAVTPALTDRNN